MCVVLNARQSVLTAVGLGPGRKTKGGPGFKPHIDRRWNGDRTVSGGSWEFGEGKGGEGKGAEKGRPGTCLLYTSDAADDC